MPESRVESISLLEWGPSVLYKWLLENWSNPNQLSDDTKRGIRLLCKQSPEASEELLMRLAASFEYEKLILSLAIEDFRRFVDSVLIYINPTASYQNLPIPLTEFRQLLALTFHKEALWPEQGFSQLLEEAVDAANKASEHLPEVEPAVNSLQRNKAVESVHDGMDRALLCAERFVELILEFLTQLAIIAGVATQEEIEKWLQIAGASEGKEEDRRSDWGQKELEIHNVARKLKEFSIPGGLEHVWLEVKTLADACFGSPQGSTKDITTRVERRIRYPEETGKIMWIIRELRYHRNNVRHASSTLRASQEVPQSYRKAANEIFQLLNKLQIDIMTIPFPTIAKVLSVSEDCFGGLEFLLAMEDRRTIITRFVSRGKLEVAGITIEPLQLLALNETSPEFFLLFPAPRSEKHVMINPLLIMRAIKPKLIGNVNLQLVTEIPIGMQEVLELEEIPVEDIQ